MHRFGGTYQAATLPGDHELRWGVTFADVTPFVAEPASLTLLGLGLLGMLGRRRR